ncbi:MAG TPA: Ig-like domain repeat protein, partial [Acidobacteriaceae bacterium]|nr:Ig-like domain repeat protein [Acidobacteriaceae bacterium]
ATAVTGVPVYATTATPTSTAGTYPISVAGLSSSNYVVAFVNGTLTVGTTVSVPVVTVGPSNPIAGQPVTITVTVPTISTTVPTGTVTFYYNGVAIGTGTLNTSGVATLTTGSLPVGTGTLTVGYSGDSNYASSTSAPVPITIAQPLDFTLTLTSAPSDTVIPGKAAPYTLQVAPTYSVYPGVVTFTATGLPAGATATFSPETVAANAGPMSVNVSIQTASLVAMNKLERNATSLALGLLLLPLAGFRRMRRSGRAAGRYLFMTLVLLAGAVATAGLTGCGANNGFFGKPPQTYNVTITAASGPIQHSVNVTLTVE